MFNRDYKPRYDLGKANNDIIMQQIRAEKQKTSIKIIQPVHFINRERASRKHFPQDLCRVTDIINHNNEESRSVSKGTGKKILRRSVSLNNIEHQRSCGKKKFEDKARQSTFNPLKVNYKKREFIPPKSPLGRKRLDHSPNNQQRESDNSPLYWHRNNIF